MRPDRFGHAGSRTPARRASVDETADLTVDQYPSVPGETSTGLDRLATLAARLVGAPSSQISLLTDVQFVAGGAGLPPGTVGSESPLAESLCTVAAAGSGPLVVEDVRVDRRVQTLPPVTSGQVGAYLGVPLAGRDGRAVGVLCAFGPEARSWSGTDVATLVELADAVVTELEHVALRRQYEGDRVRWQLAIDSAGIGAFDWNLLTGRLTWDDQLIAMFGFDADEFDESIEAFTARLHPDDRPRVG
jgi:GAF domain-containing protein